MKINGIKILNILKKYQNKIYIIFSVVFIFFILWIWHYSNNEESENKLYAIQAIAEFLFVVVELIVIILMLKANHYAYKANKAVEKSNENMLFFLNSYNNSMKKQLEFYNLQLEEKKTEMAKIEKGKILNRYLRYIQNFLFAYNRKESFDGIDTKKLSTASKSDNEDIILKKQMLSSILEIKLTPNISLKDYMFLKDDKIVFNWKDIEIKERFEMLLRECKYKLRTKVPPILQEYFKNYDTNEELQELCS